MPNETILHYLCDVDLSHSQVFLSIHFTHCSTQIIITIDLLRLRQNDIGTKNKLNHGSIIMLKDFFRTCATVVSISFKLYHEIMKVERQ